MLFYTMSHIIVTACKAMYLIIKLSPEILLINAFNMETSHILINAFNMETVTWF